MVGNGFTWFNTQATRWLGIEIDPHVTFKEHHNRCMKKAKVAEARFQTITETYRVVAGSVRAIHRACVQAVTLYESKLWWDPKEVCRQEDL